MTAANGQTLQPETKNTGPATTDVAAVLRDVLHDAREALGVCDGQGSGKLLRRLLRATNARRERLEGMRAVDVYAVLWGVAVKWWNKGKLTMSHEEQLAADLEYRRRVSSEDAFSFVDAKLDANTMLSHLPETTAFVVRNFFSTGNHEASMQRFDCSESAAIDVFNVGMQALRERFNGASTASDSQ